MKTISYTDLRKELANMMDDVCQNRTPLIITRQKGESCVLLSLEEFRAYEETAHLMRSSKNIARLMGSIEELEHGGGSAKALKKENK